MVYLKEAVRHSPAGGRVSNPCSPIIEAGSALARATRHAVTHHAHTGIGHAGAHLHAAVPHAPLYGPPAPANAALCSKVPGAALAAGPGAPAAPAAAPAAAAPASPSALNAVQAAPLGIPGAAGLSTIPTAGSSIGAAKAVLLATALAAGLGTAAVAFTATPTTATMSPLPAPEQSIGAPAIPNLNLVSIPFFGPALPDQIPEPTSDQPDLPLRRALTTPAPLAVPEPASLVTLGLGAALATLARYRLRRPRP